MERRLLFRRLEAILQKLDTQGSGKEAVASMVEAILESLSPDTGVTSARIYERRGDDSFYTLVHEAGTEGDSSRLGFEVSTSYPPVREVYQRGVVFRRPTDPGYDSALEEKLGVKTFAAIAAGPENRFILAFSMKKSGVAEPADIKFLLSTVRHVLNLKLKHSSLEEVILRAREIQLSILPKGPPDFPPYDIAGISIPAEVVSGDVYDFIPLGQNLMGICIADATGRGLPAALQARDILTGLRVGMEEDRKMVKVIQAINRVIMRSSLSSRFISLFYGELERNGNFIFVNAGHNPPFYYRRRKDRFYPLSQGGLILGAREEAQYQRGFYRILPGDMLVLYTDGIVEAANHDKEEFGVERLKEIIRNSQSQSCHEICQNILFQVESWVAHPDALDDRTVVVIQRGLEE